MGDVMDGEGRATAPVLGRLLEAVNSHDLDSLVSCFADDYVNETPAHPRRGFLGCEQVRRNWRQIFAGVPDISAQLPRTTVDGATVWTEWEMSGAAADAAPFLMRGVVIFGVVNDTIKSARFYLEPVDESSGDINAATRRVLGQGEDHPDKEST